MVLVFKVSTPILLEKESMPQLLSSLCFIDSFYPQLSQAPGPQGLQATFHVCNVLKSATNSNNSHPNTQPDLPGWAMGDQKDGRGQGRSEC